MKKYFILLTVIMLAGSCMAVEYQANLSVDTGDTSLDKALRGVNQQASSREGAAVVKAEIKESFSVSDWDIGVMSFKGCTLAEIEYLAILAKQSGKKIGDVAVLRSEGKGWGIMAKSLGVRPSELNKLRVQKMKERKAAKEKAKKRQPKARPKVPAKKK